MFKFFIENKFISSNQSGFKRGDSCINQLLSILHSWDILIFWCGPWSYKRLPWYFKSIWYGMAWWYHLQTRSKWNIRKLTKPFAQFFKEKKTTRSPQQASLYMEKYKSTSGFRSWSFIVSNLHFWSHIGPHYHLQTIIPCFLFNMTLKHLQMISIKILNNK